MTTAGDRRPGADPSLSAATARSTFDRVDATITDTLARLAVPLLRIGLGLVFLWFGVLKFFPGLSPADQLAGRTIETLSGGLVTPDVSLPVLAAWESLIGLGLLSGRFLRATLLLLAVQMAGTLTPLVLFPSETFRQFPLVPTLEGQYIIKNVVLIAAAMVVGSTVRGGRIVGEGSVARPAAAVSSRLATGRSGVDPDRSGG